MLRFDRRSITLLVVLSLTLYLFFSGRSALAGRDVVHAFVRTLPATITGLTVSLAGLFILSRCRPPRFAGQALLIAAVVVPGSILSSAIGNVLVYAADGYFSGHCASIYCAHSGAPSLVLEAIIGNLFVWSSLFMVLLWIQSLDEARVAERREAAARDAARQAQLRALRYQVNPHFLFNCLNSLATLVDRADRTGAGAMIGEMSAFLRYSLSSDPTADVDLADEVEMQRRYLEIERCRFAHRLTLKVEIDEELLRARVPSLILQPLVENAIKHGLASTSAAVTVAIRATRTSPGMLSLSVEDDAPASRDPVRGFGIGLSNVAERLALRFGAAAGLEASPLGAKGFRARITMPLEL